jgi:hypothetical protein
MRPVSNHVERTEVFDQCGHSLEAPERLADTLIEFISGAVGAACVSVEQETAPGEFSGGRSTW